jgi:hypothetical protein
MDFKPAYLELSLEELSSYNKEMIKIEKQWRDMELKASDFIVPLTDHPQHAAYMTYRQELRDYPAQQDFPNGQRPVKP